MKMKELTQLQKLQIEAIIADFKFPKVHAAMIATGWLWSDSQSTPSVREMKEVARDLMTECIANGNGNCSTGGFQATYRDGHFELAFVFEASHSSDFQTDIEIAHPYIMDEA